MFCGTGKSSRKPVSKLSKNCLTFLQCYDYDAQKVLTLQVDASSTGLSAALIQGNQPVAYASEALIPTQQKYAQIEKELLAVVFGCAKLAEYIVGHDVTVESYRRPLEAIMKKPRHVAPLRLLRMLC